MDQLYIKKHNVQILSVAVWVSVNADRAVCEARPSELQSVIRALIFLWRQSVIIGCSTTVRSPLHLLLKALWQLNVQVHVFPLGSLWLAALVWLSCLIPHHVWAAGLAPCRGLGIRNKQTWQHSFRERAVTLFITKCPTFITELDLLCILKLTTVPLKRVEFENTLLLIPTNVC